MGEVGADASNKVAKSSTTAAQARIISAALDLFTRYGVGGTSLQMIADAIGVTKAAVYHQFNTKDEIILAAAEDELAKLEARVGAAEAERSPARARDTLVNGIVDLAVAHRRTMSTVLNDPVIYRFFTDHDAFRRVMDRMCQVLVGEDIGYEARISTAMLTAAISGAVMHPLVAGLDDETLRSQVQLLARRLLPARRSSGLS
jgi:AcrR family transcriptional regulator